MPALVAIVGRPNVGKSTLFNRLVGRRLALVDSTPGLTRDRRQGEAALGDLRFTAIDTAGLDEAPRGSLTRRMREQTEAAVKSADLALFVVDGRAGITDLDRHFADWLRKTGTPVILVVNKCEGAAAAAAGLGEAFGLGFGDPVPLSAEHGEGLADLHRILKVMLPAAVLEDDEATEEVAAQAEPHETPAETLPTARPVRLAVIGRPNVGKSTLVNKLLGEERLLTGPEPGITRDAIAISWTWENHSFELIDTAGLRRKARIEERPERLASADTLRTIREAQVVILVLDATVMLEKQDLTIARHVTEEGRALVVAASKWDLVEDRGPALKRLRDRLETSLPQVKGVPFVTVSGLAGTGLDRLMEAVVAAEQRWNTKVTTAPLNRWLADATEAHPPPMVRGRRPRLRYATQTATRPPTFTFFGVAPDVLPDDYVRYLANGLRETFDLAGMPIRLHFRAGRNPYVDTAGQG